MKIETAELARDLAPIGWCAGQLHRTGKRGQGGIRNKVRLVASKCSSKGREVINFFCETGGRAVRMRDFVLTSIAVAALLGCSTALRSSRIATVKNIFVHDGVRIHYKDFGTGKPIVFLHGFGASLDSWRFIAEALRAKYRLVLIDLKGHGYSDRPHDSSYSIGDQAHIVVDLIKHLGLSDAVIVGHSLGSVIALSAALVAEKTSPGMVRGIVLIGGSVDLNSIPFWIRILRNPVIAWLIFKLTTPTFRTRTILRKAYYDDTKVTDSIVEMYAQYQRFAGTEYALTKTAEQIVPVDYEELMQELGRLRLPVVNIWGAHDEIITRAGAESTCRLIPRCTLVIIDDVGHMPQEEAPEKTILLLEKYLLEF